jgi:hyperosmotically inducible protein
MNTKGFVSFLVVASFVVLSAGCGDTTNTNTNANRNANVAMVTTPTPAATPRDAYNRNYNTRSDWEREAANYTAQAKNLGQTIGEGLEDGWIHFKVRSALFAVEDLRDSTINVDVDNNAVTLRGTVESAADKAAAEKAAKGVEGVKSLKNNLTVSASGTTNTSNANSASK